MTDHSMDILGKVPQEIAEMIFEYLRPEDLVNCFRVSIRWQQMVSHDRIWSRQLPYHKYVEKYWEDAVGESYDEGEGCLLMNRYLTESRIKNNMKQGNYNIITSTSLSWVDGRKVWSTGGGLLLSNGDQLKFKDSHDINLSCGDMTLSSDLRLLAVPYKNILYIYERKPPTVEFELFSLLAFLSAAGEEPDGSGMLSVVSCTNLDKESISSFIRQYHSRDSLRYVFFTGVDSPTERRVCVRIDPAIGPRSCSYEQIYGLWDIERNRLVHRWNSVSDSKVIEGWDGRGVCISYNTDGDTDNRIEFYDVDMRPLTVIPLEEYNADELVISDNFSVVVIISFDYEKIYLVMWEKDSTECRVLVDDIDGDILCVSPSTVDYQRDDQTVAIIAAPNWQVVAHVKAKFIYGFHLTEYSDGSLFVIMRAEE